MPIKPLPELLESARAGRYAVGYFEAWDDSSLEAVTRAAEVHRSPVIIGIGGLSTDPGWLADVGIGLYGRAAEYLASASTVPTAVLLNEVHSVEEAVLGIGAGYNALMIHTQGWAWDRLVSDTARLVAAAHAADIAVEGEVGALAEMRDGEYVDAGSSYTTVDQAVSFVDATGVDCLAVAVGSVHFVTGNHVPTVQTGLITEIAAAVDVPLVLHGGSGTPDEQVRAAIAAGISKINVGTRLKHVYGRALRAALATDSGDPNLEFGSRTAGDVSSAAAAALEVEVGRLMAVFGSAGKA